MSKRIGEAEWAAIVGRAVSRSVAAVVPVCPRCVGVTPGEPCGYPDLPHPGPFAAKLCSPCEIAVERQR